MLIKKAAAIFTAVMLAVVLSVNILTVSAKEESPEIYLECGYAQENSETVVSLVTNKKISISAYSFEIVFDPNVLSFEDASIGSAFKKGNFYSNGEYSEDCVRLVWSDSSDTQAAGELARLKFSAKNASGGTKTALHIGYSTMGNKKLEEVSFKTLDAEIEILQSYVWGDANGDEITSASDVVAINKYNINSTEYPLEEKYIINADIDYNDIVDKSDSTGVLNFVLTGEKKGGAI